MHAVTLCMEAFTHWLTPCEHYDVLLNATAAAGLAPFWPAFARNQDWDWYAHHSGGHPLRLNTAFERANLALSGTRRHGTSSIAANLQSGQRSPAQRRHPVALPWARKL
jgi:hypothetical protein